MKWIQLFKKILLFIWKEFCSFVIKVFLFLLLLAIIVGGIASYLSKEPTTQIDKGSYVLIQGSAPITEHIPLPDPLAFKEHPITFFELLYSLDSIRQDQRIKGILLDVDYLSWNKAQIEEVGRKLEALQKEGKEVIALLHEADRHNYFLASYAKEIIMPPIYAASSNITAYHYEELYWKSLLDKFGIQMNVIPIGDYKSYMENYSRGTMSPEFRANTTDLLNKSYDYTVELIAKNRKQLKEDMSALIESGALMGTSSHTLLENKWITQGKYPNEIYDEIGNDLIINIEDYYQQVKPKQHPKKYIALLTLENEIEDEFLFINEVERIQQDKNVQGVVLRIDSPGGSALAADIMYHSVKKLAEKVPVYVSISGVAASGGYYVAAAGEKIFASPLSITGSIGVVSMMPNFSGLQEKADVHSEEIIRGKYADMYSSSKPLSQENFERIREANFGVYQDFLEVVSKNRNIDKNFLDENLAQGRVWLGLEAKENKLVDALGGLEDTIYALEQDKNLGALPIVEISENDVLEAYLKKYRSFTSWNPITLTTKFPKETLWKKPLMYFPYRLEMLSE